MDPGHRLRGARRPAADGDGDRGDSRHGRVVLPCGPAVVQARDVTGRVAEQFGDLRQRQRTQLGHRKRPWMSEWSAVKRAAKESAAPLAGVGVGRPEGRVVAVSGRAAIERRSSGERARLRPHGFAARVKRIRRRANTPGYACVGACGETCAV